MKKVVGVILLLISLGIIGYGTYNLLNNKTFIVKFSGDYITVQNQIVEDGGLVSKPLTPSKEGKEFLGWYYNNNLYDFDKEVHSNMTLTGKWKDTISNKTNVSIERIVTFEYEDGTEISSVTLKDDEKVVSKPNDPVKDGYIFIGWYKNNTEYDFNKEVTKSFSLTAKFEEIKNYTVTFNSDGGSKVESITVKEGNSIYKPTNPTKKGYEFSGWQLNSKTFDFKTPITSDITLIAIWKKVTVKYTVTFDSNGGTKISSSIVNAGSKVSKPVNNPTKSGYRFVEWQLNGKTYNFNSSVTSNIILKALWEKSVSYTVTFDSNGGSFVPSVTINKGYAVPKPTNPTKDDCQFVEWRLNGVAFDFNSKITSNITLVAYYNEDIK